jgi:hypothetical protein
METFGPFLQPSVLSHARCAPVARQAHQDQHRLQHVSHQRKQQEHAPQEVTALLMFAGVGSVATQRDRPPAVQRVIQTTAIVQRAVQTTTTPTINVTTALTGKQVLPDLLLCQRAWHQLATKDSSWWDYHAWRVRMASIKTRARQQQRRASFVLLVLRLLRHRQHAPSALVASTRINTLRRWLKWCGKILLWVRLKIGRASPRRPMEQSWPQPCMMETFGDRPMQE